MQTGARTKASMRKLMQEQQISTSGTVGSGTEDNPVSDHQKVVPTKRKYTPRKSSKKGKKGASATAVAVECLEDGANTTGSFHQSDDDGGGKVPTGYSRKGKKMGRPPKPKPQVSIETPTTIEKKSKEKGKKRKASITSNPDESEVAVTSTSGYPLSTSTIDEEQEQPPNLVPTPSPVRKKPKPKGKSSRGRSSNKKRNSGPLPTPDPVVAEEAEAEEPTLVEQPEEAVEQVKSKSKPRPRPRAKISKRRKVSVAKALKSGRKAAKKRSQKIEKEEEIEEEEEVEDEARDLIEVETPTREKRMRAVKEQAKKTETETPDRSRQARAKRGSVSYKENSTSRSKSPLESPILTPSPNKKSPSPVKTLSPSPARKPSPVKKSPKSKEPVPKPSPRIKDASPSPARVKLLKEASPLEGRRCETRGSKDKDETPKRGSRKSNQKAEEKSPQVEPEPEIKTPKSSKKREPKRKSQKDTTPIRMSSPRLAKEQSVTPSEKDSSSNKQAIPLPSEQVDIISKPEKTPKSKPKSAAAKRRTLKTEKARKTLAARKRKIAVEAIQVPLVDEAAEAKEDGMIPKKKARISQSRQRKGKASSTKTAVAAETVVSESATNTADAVEMDTDPPSAPIPSCHFSQLQQGLLPTGDPIYSPLIPGKPVILDARRRSKSPRQSIDNKLISITNPMVVLPHLSEIGGTKILESMTESYKNLPGTLNIVESNALGNTTAENEQPMQIFGAEDLTVASRATKPKKPRKPRARPLKPKKELSTTPTTDNANFDQAEVPVVVAKKKTKYELKQLEFQQRKANLEVEVAQALLDMKHSSESPSPNKLLEPVIITPVVEVGNNSKPIKIRKPRTTTPRPRKRKSQSDEVESTLALPTTPISTPLPALNLSPDIATPMSNSKPKKVPRPRKPKKLTLDGSSPLTSTPTILAVPQLNGNQGIFSPNTSISFHNTPSRTTGPIKVAKTVIPPGIAEAKTSTIADIESTIADVSSGIISAPLIPTDKKVPKSRRKKKETVATTEAVTTDGLTDQPAQGNEQSKPKRVRKKKVSTKGAVSDEAGTPGLSTIPILLGSENSSAMNNGESSGPPPAKKKRSYTRPRKRIPFQLTPKPDRGPTVFAKITSNGGPPGTSSEIKEKDKVKTGPSLKVIKGKTQFFRGGEKEEVDIEPAMSKRGQTEFDPAVPWLCCFCNLGPHAQKLGDLFGPYYIEKISGTGKTKTTVKVETWMHQDCSLWAGSLVLVGSKLHGLEETLSHADKDKCTTCGNNGATIGCLKRGCKQSVHFPCAQRKSWQLNEQQFHSFCPLHKTDDDEQN